VHIVTLLCCGVMVQELLDDLLQAAAEAFEEVPIL